ncbi:hypothetical protein ADP72_08840 [Serratia plymuthica]|nr:hypothetical protein ADP72_08840 [Serratia plymuthica]
MPLNLCISLFIRRYCRRQFVFGQRVKTGAYTQYVRILFALLTLRAALCRAFKMQCILLALPGGKMASKIA